MKINGKQIDNIIQKNLNIETQSIISYSSVTNKEYVSSVINNNLTIIIQSTLNKNMVANNASKGFKACEDFVIELPLSSLSVTLNGLKINIGENLDCYFSPDGILIRNGGYAQQGDYLYWNSDKYNLTDNDIISFDYLTTGDIPSQNKMIAYYDGTISNISGNYYFIDKSGNNRNLLISNYDFDDDWIKGFPYKSAAKISAPINDTIFISADTTNFWYTNDEPNQIPVISLFQNIDYANHTFCKHYTPTQDYYTQLETYEGRIKDIAIYSGLTSNDIKICNKYFKVPQKIINAVWVDFINGNDDTGDGSEIYPFATIAKILTLTLSNDTTIYIKSGTFSTSNIITLNKQLKYIAIGMTKIISSTTVILNLTAKVYIQGFILERNTYASAYAIYVNNTNANNIISRCYIGKTAYAISMFSSSSVILNDTIFDNGISCIKYGETVNAHNITINRCFQKNINGNFFAGTSTNTHTNIINIYNSKINNNSYLTSGIWNIKGSIFKYGIFSTEATQTHSGTLNFTYNKIIPSVSGINLINFAPSYNTTNAAFTTNFLNNLIIDNNNNYILNFADQTDFLVENNLFLHYGTIITFGRIGIKNKATLLNSGIIRNNFISSSTYCGIIAVGDETIDTENKSNNLLIEKNRIILNNKENSIHGIAIFRQNSPTIRYNYIEGCGIGIVNKSLETSSSNGYVYSNLIKNCKSSLLSKGGNNILYYNNTIYNEYKLNYAFGLMASEYVGSTGATNCQFINNIVYDSSPSQGLSDTDLILYSASNNATTLIGWGSILTNNNIYTINNKYSSFANTLELAQIAGLETNSISIDPDLTVDLLPTTPISIGADLVGYKTGLDISTNWGNISQTPIVVTKENNNLQIGAYISDYIVEEGIQDSNGFILYDSNGFKIII